MLGLGVFPQHVNSHLAKRDMHWRHTGWLLIFIKKRVAMFNSGSYSFFFHEEQDCGRVTCVQSLPA
jgi:hypothetical protein